MIKIKLQELPAHEYNTRIKEFEEMATWCREQFGKNPIKKGAKKIWCRNCHVSYNEFGLPGWWSVVTPTFHFADEKHATLFALRWT